MTKTAVKPKLEPFGMVGRCFVIWGEKEWEMQGIIRGEPAPGLYLCQFFECLMGQSSTMAIFTLERFMERPWREPGSIILFENDEHLRFWTEHGHGAK
jgi:hypothetical protein